MATNEIEAGALTFRLSPQQELLWVADRSSEARSVRAALIVPAEVSADDVHAALRRVVDRHEILRTTFPRQHGMRVPSQRVNEELAPLWTAEDWRGEGDLEDAVDGLLREEAERRLDLEQGPVVSARLVTAAGHSQLLLLTIACACADAQTLGFVAVEVASLLGLSGAQLADDPFQYADYAEWRNEHVAGDEVDAAEGRAFWQDREPSAAPPPPSARRDAIPSGAALRTVVPLEPEVVARAASAYGADVELFLESCWHAHLSRLTGETEVAVAATFDGRSQDEIREAVGPYAQALPLRSRIDEETTLAEVVDQVRRARAAALRHQEYAGRDFLQGVADGCRTGFTAVASPDAPLVALVGGPVAFDLEAVLRGDAVELHYDPETLNAETVEEYARQFAALVTAAEADTGVTVADLELTTPFERQQLLDAYRTPLDAPADKQAHELFEAHAGRRPEAVAVVSGDQRLTYRELDERANRLAQHLRMLGVGRNVAVGLCMNRSAEMVEALLGILKAGGAYVPLNFEHPPGRLAHQLSETGAPVLVTQEPLLDRLPEFSGAVVCMDRDAAEIATRPSTPPDREGSADDLVYVMYTSGSTGLPKGVEVTHRNLTGYVAAVSHALELREDEQLGFAAVSAISTDLGNTSVFGGLLTGGTLHLVSPEAAMDGALFASYLESNDVDVLKVAPSQLASLIAGADVAAVLPRRWLVIGGEAARWELVDRLLSAAGSCRILNHYGPTETTIGACTFELSGPSPRRSSTAPIGRPLGNSRAYVVDRHMRLLPPGIPGELCIGGLGVARGYVGQGEQTAAVFQADPFSGSEGRLYRTGDRARLLGDGSIEFLGRVDGQLKIRGYRVEPGEIEAVLRRHPAVSDATVVGRASDGGDPLLVGYVVAPAAPSDEELTALLRDALPAYMIPSRLVRLDALPLTASGKVDRSALPDPSDSPRATEYVAPRDDLEASLAEIWEELLGVERVGVFDDFFELGGHSLLATQVVIRIRKKHADIPLHAIFDFPTVAGLAEVVAEAERDVSTAGAT